MWHRASFSLPNDVEIRDIGWNGWPLDRRGWVAVGDDGTLVTSSDGKSWKAVDTGLELGGADLLSVRAGYPRWVVVGEGGITLISPPNSIEF